MKMMRRMRNEWRGMVRGRDLLDHTTIFFGLLMSISSGDGKEGDSAEYVLRNGMNEGMI
jgi:hypothetical protein